MVVASFFPCFFIRVAGYILIFVYFSFQPRDKSIEATLQARIRDEMQLRYRSIRILLEVTALPLSREY